MFYLCFLLHLFAPALRAQIVNIEDKRTRYDSAGYYGRVDLGGSLAKNNNTVVTLNGALRVDRIRGRNETLFLADYRLVQVSGANALNAGFGHLRHGYDLRAMGDVWRWESFAQLQYNEQLRLSSRMLLGSGIRRRLFDFGQEDGGKDRGRGYLGVLYMFEYDEFSSSELQYTDHRLSSYLSLTYSPLEALTLSNTTYYQPILPDLNDPRVSVVATAVLRLTSKLAVTSNFSLTHDRRLGRDFPEVPETVYSWVNGLRYSF